MATTGEKVSVIGTGCMGRALSKALLLARYKVTIGSRQPHERNLANWDPTLKSAKLVGISEAIDGSDIIFLCLHFEHVAELQRYQEGLSGKILVDVSNPEHRKSVDMVSNAEQIQAMFLKSTVLKGFNTWSSHSLLNLNSVPNRIVDICGDELPAAQKIATIVQNMGLQPMCHSSLQYSRTLESTARGYFQGWGRPMLVVLAIFLFWLVYATIRFHYLKERTFHRFPLNTMNKVVGATSITTLSFVYLPGVFATMTQVLHGSITKRFPKFLDTWLKMRKMLGLIAFWFACFHAITSLALKSDYFPLMYHSPQQNANISVSSTPPVYGTMIWSGELTFFLGCLTLGLFAIPALTSLPSVGASLNQDQWWLCQSLIGILTLTVAVFHVAIKSSATWGVKPGYKTIQKLSVLTLFLPLFTIVSWAVFNSPCVRNRIFTMKRGVIKKELNMAV